MANPTPSIKIFIKIFPLKIFFYFIPCHPLARINAVAGPRLENCPRANSR